MQKAGFLIRLLKCQYYFQMALCHARRSFYHVSSLIWPTQNLAQSAESKLLFVKNLFAHDDLCSSDSSHITMPAMLKYGKNLNKKYFHKFITLLLCVVSLSKRHLLPKNTGNTQE